ncbi:sensor histidine kinase [uncultured Methylobacterium sp.]|uniref:sensor histidine kinase n=1 Tax=uncultured Methylobacterium sp. TaxID=157278 RepID=UPI0035CAD98F
MTATSFLLAAGRHDALPSTDGSGHLAFFAHRPGVMPEPRLPGAALHDRPDLLGEAGRGTPASTAGEEPPWFTHRAGRIGSWTLDLATMGLDASEGCKENFGRGPDAPFTYEAWIAAIHPDDRARMQAAVAASVVGRTTHDIEYRITSPEGEVRWIQSRGHAAYRIDGVRSAIAGITLDITERKRAEAHRDLLARELGHRVKNTLATVQSIIRQTLRRATSLQDAELALEARIRSLAAAHDVLIRDGWEDATLAEVVAVALRPFGVEQEGRFTQGGPTVWLASRVAVAFAMALHELATNAVKYGSLSIETGRVALSWDIVEGSSPERLRFRWQESDGPPVLPPTRTGFGSRMIERALSVEIGGIARIDYWPHGVVFTAEAPLPEVRKD